jgi:uncharacterized protein YoxC
MEITIVYIILAIIFVAIQVALIRWIFKINTIVSLLKDLTETTETIKGDLQNNQNKPNLWQE